MTLCFQLPKVRNAPSDSQKQAEVARIQEPSAVDKLRLLFMLANMLQVILFIHCVLAQMRLQKKRCPFQK